MTQNNDVISRFYQNNSAEEIEELLFNLLSMSMSSETFTSLPPTYRENSLTTIREIVTLVEELNPHFDSETSPKN